MVQGRCTSLVLAAVLGVATGCQKLNIEKIVQVGSGDVKWLDYDAPSSEQSVNITVSSPGAPVNAYLVLGKDRDAEIERLLNGKKLAAAISKSEKAESGTLEGTIPAKEGFAVLLQHNSSKTVDVTVKAISK